MEGGKLGAGASIPAEARIPLGKSQLRAANTGSFSKASKAGVFQGNLMPLELTAQMLLRLYFRHCVTYYAARKTFRNLKYIYFYVCVCVCVYTETIFLLGVEVCSTAVVCSKQELHAEYKREACSL